ncbi:hypothetical protein [Armatimonas sp.]|uniref:hypothetical protein n=1 Tax=Armatimonas sp. TaxID=1872638 RepID=UPI00375255E1
MSRVSLWGVQIAAAHAGRDAALYARVRFATHRGQPIEFLSTTPVLPEDQYVGSYVGVSYRPEQPEGAWIS